MISALALSFALAATAYAQPAPGADTQPQNHEANAAANSDLSMSIENSLSLRDPFSRYVAKSDDEPAQIPELERHELNKFVLVGIITGPKKNKALLTDPTGKMHMVTDGMVLGTRHGVITRIEPGAVTVQEKVVNLLGQDENIETAIEFKGK